MRGAEGAAPKLAVTFAVCVLTAFTWTRAGSLEPPGPPMSTMKTVLDVAPVVDVQSLPGSLTALHVISAPGSYRLTANLPGADGKTAISIEADQVTLDLAGFALVGTPSSDTAINVNARQVVIRNGTIRGWPVNGIWGANCYGCTVRDLLIEDTGLRVSTESLWLGEHGLVENTLVRGNPNGPGVRIADGGRVSSSTSIGNAIGFFLPGEGSSVIDCTATHSTSAGIVVGFGGTVQDSVSSFNGLDGIQSGANSLVRGNVLKQNIVGVFAPWGSSRIEENLILASVDVGITTEFGVSGTNIVGNQINCYGSGSGIRIAGATGNTVFANLVSNCPTGFDIATGNTVGEVLDVTAGGEITSSNAYANFRF